MRELEVDQAVEWGGAMVESAVVDRPDRKLPGHADAHRRLRAGYAFINRRSYLSGAWTADPARRAEADVLEQVAFTIKPALVIAMLAEVLAAATSFRYLCADAG